MRGGDGLDIEGVGAPVVAEDEVDDDDAQRDVVDPMAKGRRRLRPGAVRRRGWSGTGGR